MSAPPTTTTTDNIGEHNRDNDDAAASSPNEDDAPPSTPDTATSKGKAPPATTAIINEASSNAMIAKIIDLVARIETNLRELKRLSDVELAFCERERDLELATLAAAASRDKRSLLELAVLGVGSTLAALLLGALAGPALPLATRRTTDDGIGTTRWTSAARATTGKDWRSPAVRQLHSRYLELRATRRELDRLGRAIAEFWRTKRAMDETRAELASYPDTDDRMYGSLARRRGALLARACEDVLETLATLGGTGEAPRKEKKKSELEPRMTAADTSRAAGGRDFLGIGARSAYALGAVLMLGLTFMMALYWSRQYCAEE